jgi:microcystin-dependent protein
MSQPFIGEIRPFGFNFPPRNWALCAGQLMAISQNTALFSILGTTYGGNGTTTFALPDLRSRVPVHTGGGNTLGEVSGVENVTLVSSQLPPHIHAVNASSDLATDASPSGNVMGAKPRGGVNVYAPGTNSTTLAAASVGPSGPFGLAHDNMQPSLTLNFCICLFGIFPSRN